MREAGRQLCELLTPPLPDTVLSLGSIRTLDIGMVYPSSPIYYHMLVYRTTWVYLSVVGGNHCTRRQPFFTVWQCRS